METYLQLVQDVATVDHSSAEDPTEAISCDSIEEAIYIHRLVDRAIQWLLSLNRKNYWTAGVTPSVYWAIRSLPTFYRVQLELAQGQGERRLDSIEEEAWPDEPLEEDRWDLMGLPAWLSYLMALDDLYHFGLADISTRAIQRG